MRKITVIGCGLAGALVSLYMARRGYAVDVYESRPDLRVTQADKGRSINLALSCRGMTGLSGVGIMDRVKAIMVPMRARAIHEEDGLIHYQSFGRSDEEYINAIQRSELNALLLDVMDEDPRINVHFNHKIITCYPKQKTMTFETPTQQQKNLSYECLIAADGAGSRVREVLTEQGLIHSTRHFLPHGYKELSISSDYPEQLKREHLHLWPRGSYMLLGNPNTDHSITGSLFLPHEGKTSFASLTDELHVEQFFKTAFADVFHAMPHPVEEYFEHPTGHLSNIDTSPWYYQDSLVLLGDAAHGIVPFFGQGMNSAFEDCRILNQLLDVHQDDWSKALPAFHADRKQNTDAVAKMSMANYHEIQHDIRDVQFNLRKRLELELMKRYPEHYISKHVMVMFTNVPYATAWAIGEVQQGFLDEVCRLISDIKEVDWNNISQMVKKYDRKLTEMGFI